MTHRLRTTVREVAVQNSIIMLLLLAYLKTSIIEKEDGRQEALALKSNLNSLGL